MRGKSTTAVSPLRLRVAVVLIIIWWVPLWLLAPLIADMIGSSNDSHLVATITTAIVIIQTIIGILGILIAGKQIKPIIKNTPKKQAFKNVWYMLIHGKLKDAGSVA